MVRDPDQYSESAAEGRFQEATDHLYAVFAQYPKPPVECCVDTLGGPIPVECQEAWRKPLRAYSDEEFGEFARSSFCMIDLATGKAPKEVEVWRKYWLPRLLEGLGAGAIVLVTDDWFIVEQLRTANWLAWPQQEVDVIRHWCSAWLGACFAHPSSGRAWNTCRSAATCISFAIDVGVDLVPYFYEDVADAKPATVRSICDIVLALAPDLIRREEMERHNQPSIRLKQVLLRWMLHPITSERLEKMFFHFSDSDPQVAGHASEALDLISIVKNSYATSPQGIPAWLSQAGENVS